MKQRISWDRPPLFVGTVTTAAGLKKLSSPQQAPDLIEVRGDALLRAGLSAADVLEALKVRRNPVLLTLRHPSEGGVYPWAKGERTSVFGQCLDHVDAIDVELASANELKSVLTRAARKRIAVIISAHSLSRPVSNRTLTKWVERMRTLKPTVAKIAVLIEGPQSLRGLATILIAPSKLRLAVMGLGPSAPLSRLVLGALGSGLVYGYLDRPAAPGQPSILSVHRSLKDLARDRANSVG